MSARTLIPPEEYLHMTFDGPDGEYVDGEIVERTIGNLDHGRTQVRFIELMFELKKRLPLVSLTDVRMKLSEGVFRIPDISVYFGTEPKQEVPTEPPLVVVEIVSPDDKYNDISTKLHQYQAWGVPHIWIVNPQAKSLAVFRSNSLTDVAQFEIPEYQVVIPASDLF